MACPGCCAARRRLRRGALLIRGPSCRMETWVPAQRRTAEEALHRVRDTRLRQLPAQRAMRLLGRDDGLMELACRRNGVPRMLRSAPRLRRGALLVRGPSCRMETWVPALRRTAEEALHRIRDTRLRQLPAQRALRLLGRDDGLMELACRRNGVPRMLRSAPPLAAWCAADPGSILLYGNMGPGSAEQRTRRCFASPGRRCTASGTRGQLPALPVVSLAPKSTSSAREIATRVLLKTVSTPPASALRLLSSSDISTEWAPSESSATLPGVAEVRISALSGAPIGARPWEKARKRRSYGLRREASMATSLVRAPCCFITSRTCSMLSPSRRTSASFQIAASTGIM